VPAAHPLGTGKARPQCLGARRAKSALVARDAEDAEVEVEARGSAEALRRRDLGMAEHAAFAAGRQERLSLGHQLIREARRISDEGAGEPDPSRTERFAGADIFRRRTHPPSAAAPPLPMQPARNAWKTWKWPRLPHDPTVSRTEPTVPTATAGDVGRTSTGHRFDGAGVATRRRSRPVVVGDIPPAGRAATAFGGPAPRSSRRAQTRSPTPFFLVRRRNARYVVLGRRAVEPRTERVDVVVIGGGLSGLSCARRLLAGGATVRVLEARDRVGGRTLSRRLGAGTFDLGGQWLGPGQTRVATLADQLGLRTFPTHAAGKKLLAAVGGEPRSYEGVIPRLSPLALLDLQQALARVERAARRVPADRPLAAHDADALDARSLGEWMRRSMITASAREVFTAAVRVVFGAEPDEISLLWVLAYASGAGGLMRLVQTEHGAQERRFVDGAQSLSVRLRERVDAMGGGREVVRLRTAVRAIERDARGVRVRGDSWEVSARFAVVAVPPQLAARIEISPALPVPHDQLRQRWAAGATVKCLALYERPFWRECGLSGEAVFTRGPVSVTFDNGSHDGAQPCLVAFVVGGPARRWSLRPEADRRAVVLSALVRAFGEEAARPTAYVEQDWSVEPWSRGCPVSNPGPGALSAAGAAALREPVGRIHWAGTETARRWPGYLEGAIEAGERAADEVLAR
jgi:monoamine oxidase